MPRFKLTSLTDKINRAVALLSSCRLCSHFCEVDRLSGERGICRVGDQMSVASAFDHLGEEPFLVPSFAIFFASCTFSCQFCQNWDISQAPPEGVEQEISAKALAALIDKHRYCRNVNFVGGEPTPYLPFILKTLAQLNIAIPVVWNSNFYMSEESMDLLSGTVDIYLADLKFGNDQCAARLAQVPDYCRIVQRNIRIAARDSELLIRHLILPNHIECCSKPALDFISDNLGDKVLVNIMDQYRPLYRAYDNPEIARRIRADEFDKVVRYAENLGLNFIS